MHVRPRCYFVIAVSVTNFVLTKTKFESVLRLFCKRFDPYRWYFSPFVCHIVFVYLAFITQNWKRMPFPNLILIIWSQRVCLPILLATTGFLFFRNIKVINRVSSFFDLTYIYSRIQHSDVIFFNECRTFESNFIIPEQLFVETGTNNPMIITFSLWNKPTLERVHPLRRLLSKNRIDRFSGKREKSS